MSSPNNIFPDGKKYSFRARKAPKKKEENECLYCGQIFAKRSGLVTHLRVHEWVRKSTPGPERSDSFVPQLTLAQFEAIRNAIGPAKHVINLPGNGGPPSVKLYVQGEVVPGSSIILGQKDAIPAAVVSRAQHLPSVSQRGGRSEDDCGSRTCLSKERSIISHSESCPQIRRTSKLLANQRSRQKTKKRCQELREENQKLRDKYNDLAARFTGLQSFSRTMVPFHKELNESLRRENAILKIAAEIASEASQFL